MQTIKISQITPYEQLKGWRRERNILLYKYKQEINSVSNPETKTLEKSQNSEPTVPTTREKHKLIISTYFFSFTFFSYTRLQLMKPREQNNTRFKFTHCYL